MGSDSFPENRLNNFSEDGEMGSSPKNDFTPSDNPPKVVPSRHYHADPEIPPSPMPILNPTDLVGSTFRLDGQEDGQTFRARIVEAINAHEDKDKDNPEFLNLSLIHISEPTRPY